jgi:hypothetical protein
MEKVKTKNLNARVPADLLAKFTAAAKRDGYTIQGATANALRAWLDARERRARR